MQVVDVNRKDSGRLWQHKATPGSSGLLLTITHGVSGGLQGVRNVRFLSAAFDSKGDRFIAGDHQGNFFLFDLQANRFTLVQKTRPGFSALAFGLQRPSEFLVAMADHSLQCFDADTRTLVAEMRGHESVIHSVSVDSTGRYAVSCSADTAQLWDLTSFERRRRLNVREGVDIVKVFFVPRSSALVTCFKDDSVFVWDRETLACTAQLYTPSRSSRGPGSMGLGSRGPGSRGPGFRAFAVTRDGGWMVGGGRSPCLHVWALQTHSLEQVLRLDVSSVTQLHFIPDTLCSRSIQVLVVLGGDGVARFVDVQRCVQLSELRLDARINSLDVSEHHLLAMLDSGAICLYSIQALAKHLDKLSTPLLKILASNKMADQTMNSSGGHRSRGTSTPTCAPSCPPSRPPSRPSLRLGSTRLSKSKIKLASCGTEVRGLSTDRLLAILMGYGEYPAKYRMFIWRTVLVLPDSRAAYAALVDKGTHPAYARLQHDYPLRSARLLRGLQRVLSQLAHWAPILGETPYLPGLAFPFLKLFINNQLVCFEVIATVLMVWCGHWFQYFPNPPINVLAVVENLLALHDKQLLLHLTQHGVSSQVYAWPLLQTLLSEVLTRAEWLKLMDNVLTNHPAFLLAVVVAYCIVGRAALLHCSELDDFEHYFHARNALSVSQLITEAYRIVDSTPPDLDPRRTLDPFTPLTPGPVYPVFNKYPRFIVDFQVQERDRIRQQELEYLRETELTSALGAEAERRSAEERAWFNQQQLLAEAEQSRRRLIAQEELRLADQRTRLAAMKRETKLKQMALVDATRRQFMAFSRQQQEAELCKLDDDMHRKMTLRAAETQAAIEEVGIHNLELQMQKKRFEQELFMAHTDLTQQRRAEVEAWTNGEEARAAKGRDRLACNQAEQRRNCTAMKEGLSGPHALQGGVSDPRGLRGGASGPQTLQGAVCDSQALQGGVCNLQALQGGVSRAELSRADAAQRSGTARRQRLMDSESDRATAVLEALQQQNRGMEESIAAMMRQLQAQKTSGTGEALQHKSSLPPAPLHSHTQPSGYPAQLSGYPAQPSDYPAQPTGSIADKGRSDSDKEETVSLNRGQDRERFEEREQLLLAEVRDVRRRLIAENRARNRTLPAYSDQIGCA